MKKCIVKTTSADAFLFISHAPGADSADVELGGDVVKILALFMSLCAALVKKGLFTPDMLLNAFEGAMEEIGVF